MKEKSFHFYFRGDQFVRWGTGTLVLENNPLRIVYLFNTETKKSLFMLANISWKTFVAFLFVLAAVYYLLFFVLISFRKQRLVVQGSKQRPPQGEDGTNADLREPLQPLPTPQGLIHEIRLHLQQIKTYDFTRTEIILSVKNVVKAFPEEKMHLGRDPFMEEVKTSFYLMYSITLTPEEILELWEA